MSQYETTDLAFASFLVASGHAYRARAPPGSSGIENIDRAGVQPPPEQVRPSQVLRGELPAFMRLLRPDFSL
jgi:hypothetical protein